MKEIWKDIKGYEGMYQVSNLGNVKSLDHFIIQKDRWGNDGKRLYKGKILSPGKNKQGYLHISFYKNRVVETFRVNRLVYSTFVEEIPEGLQVNHIDEDKENNRVDNLNLMTPKQNSGWATRNARMAAARSKPVEAVDKVTGRVVYTFPSTKEAGRQGFHQGNISQCCNGQRKSYKGFIWRYA